MNRTVLDTYRPLLIPLVEDYKSFEAKGKDGLRAFALLTMITDNLKAYRTRKQLAEKMDVPLRTLDNAIAVAKELGWLVIHPAEYEVDESGIREVKHLWEVRVPFERL